MKRKFSPASLTVIILTVIVVTLTAFTIRRLLPREDLKGKYAYKKFESAKKCRSCHPGLYEQWSQAMMSKAYTHPWDEIEYFDLAVPHAEVKPELKGPVDGCFKLSASGKACSRLHESPILRI